MLEFNGTHDGVAIVKHQTKKKKKKEDDKWKRGGDEKW